MNEIEQIEISIEAARADIASMDALLRLVRNKDFIALIDEGYFVNEASRLVITKADAHMQQPAEQTYINNGITAIGHFRLYLRTIMATGRTAENAIKEDQKTRDELLEEER
jgi:hypothetical protein